MSRFEVINFGVPHATTDNIPGMFLAEGVSLSPSVVTFCEGANDSAVIVARVARSSTWATILASGGCRGSAGGEADGRGELAAYGADSARRSALASPGSGAAAERPAISDRAEKSLRALGYVE